MVETYGTRYIDIIRGKRDSADVEGVEDMPEIFLQRTIAS